MNSHENNDNHANNGLITKIWGHHLWEALHSISFGYPLEPTEEQKKNYKCFFNDLANVMPCIYCRQSYKEFITSGNTILTDDVFKNRESLTKWVYDLHETVNKKLGVTYGVTYEDVVDKYESYRAKCVHNEKGCIMPLNMKAESYKKASERHAPIITPEIAKRFVNYAIKRGFDISELLNLTTKINKKDKEWKLRDKICWKVIKRMRENAIPTLEKDGIYKGLPTINELKLISLLSTTIPLCDFDSITEKLTRFN